MVRGDTMEKKGKWYFRNLPALIALIVYASSLYLVLVQLIWFHGPDLLYGALLLVHSVIYLVMTFRAERLSRWRLLWAFLLGGVVIGTMPYVAMYAELSELLRGQKFEPSNLTRGFPTMLQVIIELGFIPAVQAFLAWVVLRFGRVTLRLPHNRADDR